MIRKPADYKFWRKREAMPIAATIIRFNAVGCLVVAEKATSDQISKIIENMYREKNK